MNCELLVDFFFCFYFCIVQPKGCKLLINLLTYLLRCVMIGLFVLTQNINVTDRRAHTERHDIPHNAMPAFGGKKNKTEAIIRIST